MKKMIPMLAILVISCSSPTSNYEKTIAKAVQTDKNGTFYDLDFKVLKLEELQKITVADSVKILVDNFENERETWIKKNEESITKNRESIEKEKKRKLSSKTIINLYQGFIDKSQHRIDSLKHIKETESLKYADRSQDNALAVIVRCKYSANHPVSKTRIEEEFDFTLSGDGSKYYSKKRVKQ